MKKFTLILALCCMSAGLFAQEQKSEAERQKQFFEAIDQQIERLTLSLDLEDWQVFYVDSILTHDYQAMQQEYETLSKAREEARNRPRAIQLRTVLRHAGQVDGADIPVASQGLQRRAVGQIPQDRSGKGQKGPRQTRGKKEIA